VISVVAAAAGGLMLMMGCAFLYYRLEWKALIICAALPAVTVAMTGRVSDMPLMVAPALLGCLGGFTFKKGKSLEFYLVTASVSLALVSAGVFYYMMLYEHMDFVGMLKADMLKSIEAAGFPAEVKGQYLEWFESWNHYIVALVPFGSFANSMITAGIGYAILRRFLGRLTGAVPGNGLEMFRLNDYFIFSLIAGLGVCLLIDKSNYPVLHSAGLNIALASALLYFVQALGVVKFFMMKRGMPRYLLPLIIAGGLLLGLFAVFLFVVLAGVGALDVWADFRKLAKKSGPEN
jgi:uncharacterized protein YybS (DUF2232 family)